MVDYYRYLASREWALRREAVRDRCYDSAPQCYICERCHHLKDKRGAIQVHHITYANIGQEPLEDLLGVCRPCHRFLSGISDIDPIEVCKLWEDYVGSRAFYGLVDRYEWDWHNHLPFPVKAAEVDIESYIEHEARYLSLPLRGRKAYRAWLALPDWRERATVGGERFDWGAWQ